MDIKIEDFIPQREPFKFLDKLIEKEENKIKTSVIMSDGFDFYRGHFPANPITPGVILCEACFQSGALLMALRAGEASNKTTVVTRINNAKFKNISRPGDEVIIETVLKEEIANAAFMKAKATANGKTLLTIEFAAAAVDAE